MFRAKVLKTALLSSLFLAGANLSYGHQVCPCSPMPVPKPKGTVVSLPPVAQATAAPCSMMYVLLPIPMPTATAPVQTLVAPVACSMPAMPCPRPEGAFVVMGTMGLPFAMAQATGHCCAPCGGLQGVTTASSTFNIQLGQCSAPCGALKVNAQGSPPCQAPAFPFPVPGAMLTKEKGCEGACTVQVLPCPSGGMVGLRKPTAAPQQIQVVGMIQSQAVPQPLCPPVPTLRCADENVRNIQFTLQKRHDNEAQGERVVFVQAMCVQVPMGFCQRAGLEDVANAGGMWMLTPRETKMFEALLRAERNKQVLACPKLTVADKQPGRVQVGQEVPVASAIEAVTKKDGTTDYLVRTTMRPTGIMLEVTPQVSKDEGKLLLNVQCQMSELDGTPTQMPVVRASGEAKGNDSAIRTIAFMPAFNALRFSTMVEQNKGCTTVLRLAMPTSTGTAQYETLWVLTAHTITK